MLPSQAVGTTSGDICNATCMCASFLSFLWLPCER